MEESVHTCLSAKADVPLKYLIMNPVANRNSIKFEIKLEIDVPFHSNQFRDKLF